MKAIFVSPRECSTSKFAVLILRICPALLPLGLLGTLGAQDLRVTDLRARPDGQLRIVVHPEPTKPENYILESNVSLRASH